jgi:mannose-6-phosphate isomerase
MSIPPLPVVFEPIFKPKPWGGRRLETLLGKRLPPGEPIGEAWELADLPGNESRVRGGPLAGTTLSELVRVWGRGLLGDAELASGHFPLLIKFLDACENLSVQVHPKPGVGDPRDIKHEAWYVVAAEPGAQLYIGLQPGVRPDDVARAANAPAIVKLLRAWEVQAGQCYYLPSGTPHALGAGVVVAEVQTPSDVTYRLYDWGRVGLDGRPRELHIPPALANIRYDVTENEILSTPTPIADECAARTLLLACERFTIQHVRALPVHTPARSRPAMSIWMVLAGGGQLTLGDTACWFERGDVVLVPPVPDGLGLTWQADLAWLEIAVPARALVTACGTSGA